MKYLKLLQLIFFLSLVGQCFPQTSQIDSLKAILVNLEEDTSKVNTLNALASNVYRSAPDEAIKIGSEAKKLAEQLNYQEGLAYALKFIGIGYYMQGNYVEASINWELSLEIFKTIDNENGIANILGNLGTIHGTLGETDKAIEYHLQSLKIAEKRGDSIRIATCLNNIGTIYSDNPKTFNEALEYYSKSVKIGESCNYPDIIGTGSYNLGMIFSQKDMYDSALYYFEKSKTAANKTVDVADPLNYIGIIYAKKGNYQTAIKYQQEALEIAQKADAKLQETTVLLGLAYTYQMQGNPRFAINYFEQAETIAKEIGLNYELKDAYEGLASTHAELSDFQNAYKYLSLLNSIEKTIYNIETDDKINKLMFSYQLEKKENQIELQKSQIVAKDATIKQQKTYRNALGAGFFAVILIIIVIVYAYVQKRKANKKIIEQNEQILETNEELIVLNEAISKQNIEIVDSINYAQRIQSAMLPPESYVTELLNENFILYKPRDIVSGDFYWIKQVNQYIVLVAADCTGHGIPGALMSMLGISYLNEIVQRREITQSNQILNELRKQIKFSLRQHGQPDEAKDGIDMSLCVLDLRNMKMQYSGANNPLYLISDVDDVPELKEIKADRMPIGYYQGKDKTFTNHDVQLEMGDTFYIFSDGFIDQKGGKDNKKFMSKNFKNLLLEIHDQAMYDQKDILDKKLVDWMGSNSQMDDILVIGVRV
jgi:serine phosphatase RsbU (regulator of sigma subunit)